jgi:hypothetical protein
MGNTSMSDAGSVSRNLDDFKNGDDDALGLLMARYRARLEQLAEVKIRASGGRISVGDGADAASSAFRMLWQGVRDDRFPSLNNRRDLWNVLKHLAGCKAIDMVRAQFTQSQGGGNVRNESELQGPDGRSPFERVLREGPGPEQVAMFEEEIARLLGMLKDPTLREVARLDLEGHTDQEIADRVGKSKRWVSLKLEIIRKTWRGQGAGPA